jgi:cephalosporin-C deacetylase
VTARRPPARLPPDFDRFWRETRRELAEQDPHVRRTRRAGDGAIALDEVEFRSLRGARICGYLLRHTDGGRRPLIVHAHGYGDCYAIRWEWARAGYAVLGFDVRGFGRSRPALPAPSPHGWILTGIDAPERSVLRGAVCDYVRAVEVGQQLLADAVSGVVLHGTSFAGGLAVMAEAQRPVAQLLALGVPTFGWMEGRRLLAHGGSGLEVRRFLDARGPEHEEDVMLVLRYFDTMHHAEQVSAPAIVGVGAVDPVVPAPTVFAVANRLRTRPEVWQLPVSHSDSPEERWWETFEQRWLTRGLTPTNFS